MKNPLLLLSTMSLGAAFAQEAVKSVVPVPPVVPEQRVEERPIGVSSTNEVVEANAFFTKMRTTFVFVNENSRQMSHDLVFPLPEGAIVCGYALEVNGEMIPGVVCEKEKARVAYENEVRKGVDPGLVEQVKKNVWQTRIFPLRPNEPRHATLDYIVPKTNEEIVAKEPVYERDGQDVFLAEIASTDTMTTIAARIASFSEGVILWDTSLSRLGKVEADRAKLSMLPENGAWTLITFAETPDAPRSFSSREELLKTIDGLVYDGGTDISAALKEAKGLKTLLMSDEFDTLSLVDVSLETNDHLILGSRAETPLRTISVRKIDSTEVPSAVVPRESTLLATVWAARRMEELAQQADARKDEFLALGRKYGVAGNGLSLIVLENLNQWIEHDIEPPKTLSFHDEWVRCRNAIDDPIAAKRAEADFQSRLLVLWEERVKWWNDPKPKIETPKSGLFETVRNALFTPPRLEERAAQGAMAIDEEVVMEERHEVVASRSASAPAMKAAMVSAETAEQPRASINIKAWNPDTPYLKALRDAGEGAYEAYLKERETYRDSPAFYLDCAGHFFAIGQSTRAARILTNLAEFKIDDVAQLRTLGWRAREAGSYELAVLAFRKVLLLRGEEGIARRDLALVLMERGKRTNRVRDLEEAAELLKSAAFDYAKSSRRSMRRSNDIQVSIVALEELNGLMTWCAANRNRLGEVKMPEIDPAYRRDLPVKLRIVLSWNADQTDIDLHVLEPNGEEAFYGHRRTREGGFVSEDVTTGYGPEEYLKKDLERGVYKILTNYFASHQTSLFGATCVQATVYTDWATEHEQMKILTLRLDKPKDKCIVGEVTL